MAERQTYQKEKSGAHLELKESEHQIAKFQKDSKEAASKVCIFSSICIGKLSFGYNLK